MQLIKKLVISVVILLLLWGFYVSLMLIRVNVSAKNLSEYWQEEGLGAAEYIVVIMGDSEALGVGASNPSKSFASRLKEKISEDKGKTVKIVNVASLNATFEQVLEKQIPKLLDVEENLIIISAGRINVEKRLLDEDTLRSILISLPSGISYVTEIPAGNDPQKNEIAKQFNEIIIKLSEKQGIDVIPLYDRTLKSQFDLSYYDWDFVHPNDNGHKIWADIISEKVL
jgi:lysophospholipase L1-like esterase